MIPQKPGLPHANSAPVLGNEMMQGHPSAGNGAFARHPELPRQPYSNGRERPPPPPTHRNSAPVPGQTPHRPLPVPQSRQPPHASWAMQGSHSSPIRSPAHEHDYVERRRSGDAMNASYHATQASVHPHPQQYIKRAETLSDMDPRHSTGNIPTMYNAVSSHAFVSQQRARQPQESSHITTSPVDARDGPVLRPRAISPSRKPQPASYPSTPGIPRKSVNAASTPNHSSPSLPYSPDSYDAYNPNSSLETTPSTTYKREPSPMYSSQTTPSHTQSPLSRHAPTAPKETPIAKPSPPVPALGNYHLDPHSPIMNSKGRFVDPTDHLPASSYAPEPEPKPGDVQRAAVTAHISSRFGPREARPAPVTTRSLPTTPSQGTDEKQGRNRLQKRLPNGSSPLAPSPPHAINANYSVPQVPPPVPGKIPFDAEGYGEDDTRGLSHGMGRLYTDPGMGANMKQSPLQRIEAVGATPERYGGGRGRRSKYGA